MARGDTETAFVAAAASDGITLIRASFTWINQRGHFGLPPEAESALPVLSRIFTELGGIEAEQAAKKLTKLPGDFIHPASGVCIETDESQHFTSHRARTLDLYPKDAPLGFNIDDYKALCVEWAPTADRFRANKAAVGFGPNGRQRQRAYNDALRDLATPMMGLPPLIRVAAPERDGALAYERVRELLRVAISS